MVRDESLKNASFNLRRILSFSETITSRLFFQIDDIDIMKNLSASFNIMEAVGGNKWNGDSMLWSFLLQLIMKGNYVLLILCFCGKSYEIFLFDKKKKMIGI